MKNYTTQTAALKATMINSRKIDTKQIDAQKIYINGEQVEANPERVKSIGYGGFIGHCGFEPIVSSKFVDDFSILTNNGLNYDVPEVNVNVNGGNPPYSNTFLWGTTSTFLRDVNKDNKLQLGIIDGFVGLPPKNYVQDNPSGSDASILMTFLTANGYPIPGAALPEGTQKVIHNFVYDTNGKITTTIRPERMYSNFFAAIDTLEEWVADMPNYNKSTSVFNWGFGDGGYTGSIDWGSFCGSGIRKFVGDLSSLKWGKAMFVSCENLEIFSGLLSSLVEGDNMFKDTNLNLESVENIMYALPHVTDGTTPTITISWVDGSTKLQDESFKSAVAELFVELVNEKGWSVDTNAAIGTMNGNQFVPAVTATDGTTQIYKYFRKKEIIVDETITMEEALEKITIPLYYDSDNKYYIIESSECIIGPAVKLWEIYPSLEDAISSWGLTAK